MAIYRNIDIDESGDVGVNTACTLFQIIVSNENAAGLYLKLYDKATAPDENDTPVMTIETPSKQGPASIVLPGGEPFSSGLGVRATTGAADNDTGAPGANDMVGIFRYVNHTKGLPF